MDWTYELWAVSSITIVIAALDMALTTVVDQQKRPFLILLTAASIETASNFNAGIGRIGIGVLLGVMISCAITNDTLLSQLWKSLISQHSLWRSRD